MPASLVSQYIRVKTEFGITSEKLPSISNIVCFSPTECQIVASDVDGPLSSAAFCASTTIPMSIPIRIATAPNFSKLSLLVLLDTTRALNKPVQNPSVSASCLGRS